MNAKDSKRLQSLMPNGIPRWIRCYDAGEDGGADRYTVCYTGRTATLRCKGYANEYPFVGMSASPFHPQGVGMHGSTANQPCDTIRSGKRGWNWPPAVGRKHPNLGLRIEFKGLPPDCQKLVVRDYVEIWGLEGATA